MITLGKLHEQNHKITELSNVFLYLSQDRAMCDTAIACDIFLDYSRAVKEHIELVDRKLCGQLISHPDQSVKNTANRFLSGSSEIKRIFAAYLKRWCSEAKRELTIRRDYDEFVAETSQMFNLVLDRIERETEHLYPLVRRLEEGERQAA